MAMTNATSASIGNESPACISLVTPPNAALAWVGDSRAYVMEGSTLRQVTKDHSLVQRLVEIGQISAEEARTHEHKNVITRSLGARLRRLQQPRGGLPGRFRSPWS